MSRHKDPAFLFYPEAFTVGTLDFTDAQVGRYIRLLCRQHHKGHITAAEYEKAPDAVKDKFVKAEDGTYYNERLAEEIDRRKKWTESRQKNGARGGRPKKEEEPEEEPIKNHMETICEKTENHIKNRNTNTNKNKDISNISNINSKDISPGMKAVYLYRERIKGGAEC